MVEISEVTTVVSVNSTSSQTKKKIALLMMVKNEHLRIKYSLDSVLGIADVVVVLDTGSTDGTQDIIREWCKEHNLPLHLKEEPFTTFCKSRNVSLDYLDELKCADYALLLDCNDELRNGELLRRFADEYTGPCSAFHVCQIWWNGISNDKYYNVRLVKPGNGWRYKRNVHEYMSCPGVEKYNKDSMKKMKGKQLVEENPWIVRIVDKYNFHLFQDRTKDDDKSYKRFARDKVLLYDDYVTSLDKIKRLKSNKNSLEQLEDETCDYSRTLFYLAQTLSCLSEQREAYRFYKLRLTEVGFTEEIYHAHYRCGDLSQQLKMNIEEAKLCYHRAIFFSTETFINPRVEALVKLTEIYIQEKNWKMAYNYLKTAITIPYPEELILFIDRRTYDYTRFHLMGVVGYQVGDNQAGFDACLTACLFSISFNQSYENDLKNIKNYLNDEDYTYVCDTLKTLKDTDLCTAVQKDTQQKQITSKIKLIPSLEVKYLTRTVTLARKSYAYHSEKALEMEKRSSLTDGQKIELYNHYIACGDLCPNHLDEKVMWNIKALEMSCLLFGIASVDAFVNLASHFSAYHQWKTAMLFIKFACDSQPSALFSLMAYDYYRWYILGKISIHLPNPNRMETGRIGCVNAIIHGNDTIHSYNENFTNLRHYIKNEGIISEILECCKVKNADRINLLLRSPELMSEVGNTSVKLQNKLKEKSELRKKKK